MWPLWPCQSSCCFWPKYFLMGEGGHQFSPLLLLSTVSLLFSFTLKLYDVKGGKKIHSLRLAVGSHTVWQGAAPEGPTGYLSVANYAALCSEVCFFSAVQRLLLWPMCSKFVSVFRCPVWLGVFDTHTPKMSCLKVCLFTIQSLLTPPLHYHVCSDTSAGSCDF